MTQTMTHTVTHIIWLIDNDSLEQKFKPSSNISEHSWYVTECKIFWIFLNWFPIFYPSLDILNSVWLIVDDSSVMTHIISFFEYFIRSECSLSSYFNYFASSKGIIEYIWIQCFSRCVINPWEYQIFNITNHPLTEKF